ncbi:protein kinase [Streptomyces sp. NPDC090442]|uniref:protein kinase domain-containing protein n=1 Tax=Streptomyces sp. NPDC090442 TaxID=3365962 RepID=UPI003826F9F0
MISALRAAHSAGVLHRDVKPGNVLLGEDGRVVLTDFGIAVATGTSTLTKTGELVGSIDYLAPERVKGGTPGPASDLWALGATLYQAVEGKPPFRKNTAVETAYAIAVDPLEPPRSAGQLTALIEAPTRPVAHGGQRGQHQERQVGRQGPVLPLQAPPAPGHHLPGRRGRHLGVHLPGPGPRVPRHRPGLRSRGLEGVRDLRLRAVGELVPVRGRLLEREGRIPESHGRGLSDPQRIPEQAQGPVRVDPDVPGPAGV